MLRLTVLLVVPTLLAAQPPARAPRAATTPTAPVAPLAVEPPIVYHVAPEPMIALEAGAMALEASRAALEASRAEMVAIREGMHARVAEARELAMVDAQAMRAGVRALEAASLAGGIAHERGLAVTPRAAWASQDPADSTYRQAREALNRGEYRRAVQLFAAIQQRQPRSRYAADAAYWEAFGRYRIGTTEDLRQAARVLDGLTERREEVSRDIDVSALRARIAGALAARGDNREAARVQQAAQQAAQQAGQSGNASACDREDLSVRVEALSALAQMDPAASLPVLQRVLERRDECSAELRRRAVFMVARRGDADAARIVTTVVRSDPHPTVRAEAMMLLGRMPGDGNIAVLEEILRTSDEERIQRAAVAALASSSNPRARQATRAIIERTDVSERLRQEAIHRLGGEDASAEDATYLRSLYPRMESIRLREAVINSVARTRGRDNETWLLAIVRNQQEPSELRAAALERVGQMTTVAITDLIALYDAAEARSLREQVIRLLANRRESQATDKLIDIARNGTDPSIRRQAINALTRRNDPRATQALLELIDR